MNISIDQLLQPQRSYSRTGKMTEGLGAARAHAAAGSTKKQAIDYSKLLAANELGGQEAPSAALCSSPRLHPSVLQKEDYVHRSSMEAAFRRSMSDVLSTSEGSSDAQDRANDGGKHPHKGGALPADWKKAWRELRQQELHKHQTKPSPAFLALSRDRVTTGGQQGIPPVGHYRPRYEFVEESAPRVKIGKRTSSPQRGSRSPTSHGVRMLNAASPRKLHESSVGHSTAPYASFCGSASGGGGSVVAGSPTAAAAAASAAAAPGIGSPTGEANNSSVFASPGPGSPAASAKGDGKRTAAGSDATTSAPHMTWPFASKSPGHVLAVNRSWSVEPDPTRRANVAATESVHHVVPRVYCSMALMCGRPEQTLQLPMKDVFYDVRPAVDHRTTATPAFQRTTAREKPPALPRTSAEVPRGAVQKEDSADLLDMTKFRRQPVLVDFHRASLATPSRKQPAPAPPENDVPLEALLRPFESAPRSPDFTKYTNRKSIVEPALDLVYDVRYSAVDVHEASTSIVPPSKRSDRAATDAPNSPTPHLLLPDDSIRHPKLTTAIPFDGYTSREKRARCGRAAAAQLTCEAQQVFYDVDRSSAPRHVAGDVKMATQVSREQRMEIQSPLPLLNDNVYDVKADSLFPTLRRGMVEIDKMVDREKRAHSSLR